MFTAGWVRRLQSALRKDFLGLLTGGLSVLLWGFLLLPAAQGQIVVPKRTPVIAQELQTRLASMPDDSLVQVWVFFTDKGFTSRQGFSRRLAEASSTITARAMSRRQRRGSIRPLVGFEDLPVASDYVDNLRAIAGVHRLRTVSRWLNAASFSMSPGGIAAVARLPYVRNIRRVRVLHRRLPEETDTSAAGMARPTLPAQTSDLDYGPSWDQLTEINVIAAHRAGYSGQGILVLMLDTGYFKDHEAIDTTRLVAEYDFIQGDSNTQNDSLDYPAQQDHGTATASILGAAVPGELYGPAYQCEYLLAKTEIVNQEIEVEEDYYVEALEWGEGLGADVASSSLGYTDWYKFTDMNGRTAVTTRAVNRAIRLGLTVVTAAGNENDPNNKLAWNHIIAPADADSVISVGAVDADSVIASFSSHGPTSDGRIKPEVVARGVSTYAAADWATNAFTYDNGTSMSTPLVAGAAALILQAHPDWGPAQVRRALMETADNAFVPNNIYGWGVINAMAAIQYSQPSLQDLVTVQNYPNPCREYTFFKYPMADSLRSFRDLRLEIYDIRGRKVVTLRDPNPAGVFEWDLTQTPWDRLPNGVYLYRLMGGPLNVANKLTILR